MCRELFFRQWVETSKWRPKAQWNESGHSGEMGSALLHTGLLHLVVTNSCRLSTINNSTQLRAELRLLENISCERSKVVLPKPAANNDRLIRESAGEEFWSALVFVHCIISQISLLVPVVYYSILWRLWRAWGVLEGVSWNPGQLLHSLYF